MTTTNQHGAAAKVLCVVGARPNLMKIAPILRAFRERAADVDVKLVHTGQHYDYAMNAAFFTQLGIPDPDISLDVGSASHAVQTAEIMRRFEPVVDAEQPDVVLVVGDVNSTIACALVAVKKGVRVVHVEAGLRSRDRSMPEEINRVLTDQISDRLYVTERDAIENLRAEGIAAQRIVFAGNVMIDTLLHSLAHAVPAATTIAAACVAANRNADVFTNHRHGYGLLTLHRPSNVDDPGVLARLLETLNRVSRDVPLIFPVHPRTLERIRALQRTAFLDNPRVLVLPPTGYFQMLGLTTGAKVVLTDSGGLQEETTALGVACLTLRENTERPITLREGTNTLVGTDADAIIQGVESALRNSASHHGRPELWDGHAAQRIVEDLLRTYFAQRPAAHATAS